MTSLRKSIADVYNAGYFFGNSAYQKAKQYVPLLSGQFDAPKWAGMNPLLLGLGAYALRHKEVFYSHGHRIVTIGGERVYDVAKPYVRSTDLAALTVFPIAYKLINRYLMQNYQYAIDKNGKVTKRSESLMYDYADTFFSQFLIAAGNFPIITKLFTPCITLGINFVLRDTFKGWTEPLAKALVSATQRAIASNAVDQIAAENDILIYYTPANADNLSVDSKALTKPEIDSLKDGTITSVKIQKVCGYKKLFWDIAPEIVISVGMQGVNYLINNQLDKLGSPLLRFVGIHGYGILSLGVEKCLSTGVNNWVNNKDGKVTRLDLLSSVVSSFVYNKVYSYDYLSNEPSNAFAKVAKFGVINGTVECGLKFCSDSIKGKVPFLDQAVVGSGRN